MAILIDGWSIVPQYRKCGKPTCKVCRADRGHGPYYYGTKLVDGKKKSRYFGTKAPVTIESSTRDHSANTQAYTQELRGKEEQLQQALDQLSAVRHELSILREENEALKKQLSAYEGATFQPNHPQELTPDDVTRLWQAETKHSTESEEILHQAYQSLLRGLFPQHAPRTSLYKGKGNRPYVCPFRVNKGGRGGQMRFSSATRLVATAIPWLITQASAAIERANQHQMAHQSKSDAEKAQFYAKSTTELHALKTQMTQAITTHNFTGWIIHEEQMKRYVHFIDEILQERGST